MTVMLCRPARCLARRWTRLRSLHDPTFHSKVTADESLVYAKEAPAGYDESAFVYPNVISSEEEEILIQDLQQIFRR